MRVWKLPPPSVGAGFGASVALCLSTCCLLSTATLAAEAEAGGSLDQVVVIGNRPTSLPTEIPTTIEGITAAEIDRTINATDAQDALKYFPSLLVRKRYIGDYDHAVLATRASGTGNSARSLIYADGILLSNLLGNGASFTPRWGLVTPEEIERVDVLYGPFSAAYPGNSVGAVVDYVTRMPEKLEAHVRVGGFTQQHDEVRYGVKGEYSGYQASASVGDKIGGLSWWVNFNRLDSDGQPIVFGNKLVSTAASTLGPGGTVVTGAQLEYNPKNQPWWILGSTNQIHTVQDHAKVKLAYDFTDTLRASYTFGAWSNDAVRTSESYLRDANGTPVYAGTPFGPDPSVINIDGRRYTLLPSDLAPSRGDLLHMIHGLSIKSYTQGAFDWEVAGSLYDYTKDLVRTPTVAVPNPDTPGAGRITDMDGTGWTTLALKGVWRPGGSDSKHLIDFGYQRDAQELQTNVYNTTEWISGSEGARVSLFGGKTELQSVYLQDTWRFAADWRATLGARVEQWRATDGVISSNATTDIEIPGDRTDTFVSPKAAIAYQATEQWAFKASVGRAVRNPTVSELYQGSVTAGTIVNNNPNLLPEKSYTGELTAELVLDQSQWRSTVFHEDTRDALYSQSQASATGGTVNTVQNVQHIRTTGIELVYTAVDVLVSGFDLSSSVTYADSKIIQNDNFLASEGKRQPRVPDWRANLLASYRLGEDWDFSLGTRYSGRQYNTLDNSDPNGKSYTGVSKFLVMDLRVRCRIAEQWRAAFGIDNLNNDNYWNFHPYPERTYSAELSWDL